MSRRFYVDMAERVLWTFAQGFLAEWLVTATLDLQTLKVAAGAGLISAAKCLLASRVGERGTASTVPS